MEVRVGLKRLRTKVQRLHREYEAMLVISNRLTIGDRGNLDRQKENITHATKSGLQRMIRGLQEAIKEYRTHFGFKAPSLELFQILDRVEMAAKNGKLLRITKDWIEEICTGY